MSASSVIMVTNAPEVYDYPQTVLRNVVLTSRFANSMGGPPMQHPFRRVTLDNLEGGYYVDYQCGRYRSGGYLVLTLAQYEREVREGYIVE